MQLITAKEARLESGDLLILPFEVNYYYITTQEDADLAVQELLPLSSHKDSFLAVDIETSGFCPHRNAIYLLQIGTSKGRQYIFDMRKDINPESLREVLEGPCWKVGHNIRFDAKFLMRHYKIDILNNAFDTFVAEKVLKGGVELYKHFSLDQ